MKKMKTIKFPNTKEAYDIYDDEAVRSINGNKPDENGNVADVALKSDIERLTEEIAVLDIPFKVVIEDYSAWDMGIKLNKSGEDIRNALQNRKKYAVLFEQVMVGENDEVSYHFCKKYSTDTKMELVNDVPTITKWDVYVYFSDAPTMIIDTVNAAVTKVTE